MIDNGHPHDDVTEDEPMIIGHQVAGRWHVRPTGQPEDDPGRHLAVTALSAEVLDPDGMRTVPAVEVVVPRVDPDGALRIDAGTAHRLAAAIDVAASAAERAVAR